MLSRQVMNYSTQPRAEHAPIWDSGSFEIWDSPKLMDWTILGWFNQNKTILNWIESNYIILNLTKFKLTKLI